MNPTTSILLVVLFASLVIFVIIFKQGKKESFINRPGHIGGYMGGAYHSGSSIGPNGRHIGGNSWYPYAPYGVYLPPKSCEINEDCPFKNCLQSGYCEN